MSDTSPSNKDALLWNAPKPTPRQTQPGELLFEFHIAATHKFWRVELRDHGRYGIEAQFFDPAEFVFGRRFWQALDPTRTPRDMAIAWATEYRKELEAAGAADGVL